eukprot:scaffold803_cov310-Pinguiococcus_pyrenoidosus.AAC.147
MAQENIQSMRVSGCCREHPFQTVPRLFAAAGRRKRSEGVLAPFSPCERAEALPSLRKLWYRLLKMQRAV